MPIGTPAILPSSRPPRGGVDLVGGGERMIGGGDDEGVERRGFGHGGVEGLGHFTRGEVPRARHRGFP
jgi:hypothetical protein